MAGGEHCRSYDGPTLAMLKSWLHLCPTSIDIQGLDSDNSCIGGGSRYDINDWCLLNQNEQKLDAPGGLKELELSTAQKKSAVNLSCWPGNNNNSIAVFWSTF
jgi:hypothetical protein